MRALNQRQGIVKKDVILGFSYTFALSFILFFIFYVFNSTLEPEPYGLVGTRGSIDGDEWARGFAGLFLTFGIVSTDVIAVIVSLILAPKRGWGYFVGVLSAIFMTILFYLFTLLLGGK